MPISSALKKILASWTDSPLSGFIRSSDNTQKLDVAVSEIVTLEDYFGEVALGKIPGRKSVNKFGAAPMGVQTTKTDIWDRADATPTQPIWIAPTQARIHAIVSSSASDTPGGTGVGQVIIYGLKNWNEGEVSETVTLNGITPVNTGNAYVIIHRMKVIQQASTTNVGGGAASPGPNVGTISATAAVNGTVTAVILPGNGQTEMAIYGVPSIQNALLYRWSAQLDRTIGASVSIDMELRVNENPNVQLLAFLRKDDISLQSTGTSSQERKYGVPYIFPGPCIIKVQAVGSAVDIDAETEFDLILVNK